MKQPTKVELGIRKRKEPQQAMTGAERKAHEKAKREARKLAKAAMHTVKEQK